jgi:hypothetical protein
LGSRVEGLGFKSKGSGFRVQGLEFRVSGFGFGFRVYSEVRRNKDDGPLHARDEERLVRDGEHLPDVVSASNERAWG